MYKPRNRMSRKARRFIEAYYGEAKLNSHEAARIAGYSNVQHSARMLLQRYANIMEQKAFELAEKSKLSGERILEELTKVALDTDNPAQRVRALEILAKIHGMTNDKVNVTVDRKLLTADLDAALAKLAEAAAQHPALLGQPTLPAAEPDLSELDSTIRGKTIES